MPRRKESDRWTSFGAWSKKDILKVLQDLEPLRIRHQTIVDHQDEEYLRRWYSWDLETEDPSLCFHLYIHDDDVDLVGDFFIIRFPEREYLKS